MIPHAQPLTAGQLDCANASAAAGAAGKVDPADRASRPIVVKLLPNLAGRQILLLADRCLEITDLMDNFVGGRRRASLLVHPAFVALVHEFAMRFELLVAAVDALHIAGLPWKHLVSDARLTTALEAGIRAERRLVESRALKKFLAENLA